MHRCIPGLCPWPTSFCSLHITRYQCNKFWPVKNQQPGVLSSICRWHPAVYRYKCLHTSTSGCLNRILHTEGPELASEQWSSPQSIQVWSHCFFQLKLQTFWSLGWIHYIHFSCRFTHQAPILTLRCLWQASFWNMRGVLPSHSCTVAHSIFHHYWGLQDISYNVCLFVKFSLTLLRTLGWIQPTRIHSGIPQILLHRWHVSTGRHAADTLWHTCIDIFAYSDDHPSWQSGLCPSREWSLSSRQRYKWTYWSFPAVLKWLWA